MLGKEFIYSKDLNFFERLYIFLFGIPILGLRIRAWRMLPLIFKYAKNCRTVLDIGSGRGVFTLEIAKKLKKSEIIGVDTNKKKVHAANEIINKILLANCSFKLINILDKDFKGKFDCIIAIDVLEHIRDDFNAVKKLYTLLNPKGILIIHVPHKYRYLLWVWRLNFDIEGHKRPGYLMEDIKAILIKSKFNILDNGYTYSFFETLANDISYFITEGREKRKLLYSLFFPFLLIIAGLGRKTKPKKGSGVFIIGKK